MPTFTCLATLTAPDAETADEIVNECLGSVQDAKDSNELPDEADISLDPPTEGAAPVIKALQRCARWMMLHHQSHTPEFAAACEALGQAGFSHQPELALEELPAVPVGVETPDAQNIVDAFVRDLVKIGFGDEDEPINGGDLVDLVNEHFEDLGGIASPGVVSEGSGDDEDPMGITRCDRCDAILESGQIGLCDDCGGDHDPIYVTRDDAVNMIVGLLGDGGSTLLAGRVFDYMREQGIVTHNGKGFVIERDANVFQYAANLAATIVPDEIAAKLPERAYLPNRHHCTGPQGEPPIIGVSRGEVGYWPLYTNLTADELNAPLGVTPDQLAAMEHGSMFGWDTPGADPDWHRKLRERREQADTNINKEN